MTQSRRSRDTLEAAVSRSWAPSRFKDLRLRVPANLAAIGTAVAAFRHSNPELCEPRASFGCELLLREALTNAVVHGSQGSDSAPDPWERNELDGPSPGPAPCADCGEVLCIIRPRSSRILIWVEDQGPGFDWRKSLRRESDPATAGGRGMEIYRKYATRVRFNTKGNAVALLRRF